MNRKHIGSSFFDTVDEWKKNPAFRQAYEERREKFELALQIKKLREHEGLSQRQLAKISSVPQSVIARIESMNSKTLPRLDLVSRIVASMGYSAKIVFNKDSRTRHRLAGAA